MTNNSGGGSAALIHLSCFGGFRVTADRPLGAPFLQPGGVAMLAILAARGDTGISGDELRALAWGDLPEAEGRAALATALTALWRGGNGDSLLAVGDRIAFHPERVTTDVARFVAACERGDAIAASQIYEGPYFGGVVLDAGPAFNEWLDATRDRFNTQYQEVAREARRAARKGGESAAPDWTAPIELMSLSGEEAAPEIGPVVSLPATENVAQANEPVLDVVPDAPTTPGPILPVQPEEGVAVTPHRRIYLWLGAAAVVCVVLALLITGRSDKGANGSAALRRGDFATARTALTAAVARDSSDGWRWFELARAADGDGDAAAADAAALRADSLRESLPANRATLVHGYQLWRSGNTLSAITLLDSLVQQEPEFEEAAAVLGEVQYRSAPLIGQSRVVARAALERAVALDPAAGATWHRLLAIALANHDTAKADHALAGLRNAMGPGADSAYGWLRGLWTADTGQLQRVLARAATTTSAGLLEQTQLLGIEAGRTTDALTLTESLLDEARGEGDRVSGRVLRAALFGAVDDWTRADAEAALLAHDWPWGGLMLEAAAMLSPTRSVRSAELRAVRDRLVRFVPDTTAPTIRHRYLPAASRTVRFYLLGELAYRLNDPRGLQVAVDSLSGPGLGELTLPRTGGSYALTLQALQSLLRGDSTAALARLEQASGAVPVAAQQQLWVNGTLERRRRAVLLTALGRPGEAAGWVAGVGEYPVDLLLGPPLR